MRILFLTDTHIRGTSPENRLDDFPKTLKEKLLEVIKICKENNIDYILHGGDFFDRPDVSLSVVGEYIGIFKAHDIPIYLITGNHDVYGHNPKTLNRTIMGIFEKLDLLTVIHPNKKYFLKKDDLIVQLTGQPYIYNIDDKLQRRLYKTKKDEKADYSIHLTHGMLLDKPFIKHIPHTLIDHIKDTEADITLGGHYHTGYEVKLDNKYFLNPGSLVRITNSLEELKRKPKVYIIDLDKNRGISYKGIYLKSAKKGEKVLDRKKVENNIYKSERMYEFKQSINAAIDFKKMDINELLLKVSTSEDVDENVKEEALKRIANVQIDRLGDNL